jgi:hypothetical protein
MSRPFKTVILGAILSTVATWSLAQDGIPDISGTWSISTGAVILADGSVHNYPDEYQGNDIEITKQTGPVFTATQKVPDSASGGQDGVPFAGKPYSMVGALDGTGPYVVFADVGGSTMIRCALVDLQTMRCLIAQAGDNALAGFFLYRKKQ